MSIYDDEVVVTGFGLAPIKGPPTDEPKFLSYQRLDTFKDYNSAKQWALILTDSINDLKKMGYTVLERTPPEIRTEQYAWSKGMTNYRYKVGMRIAIKIENEV